MEEYITEKEMENILQVYKVNQSKGLALFRRALIPSFKQFLKGTTTPFQNYSLKEFKALLDELVQKK